MDQLFGQAPVRVVLTGPTQTDPRAHAAVQANATEIFRFWTNARDVAIKGQLPQQVRNATLTGGIRARYIFNNGQETLLLQVPLTNPEPTSSEEPEEPTHAQRNLVIDVLMPCNPYQESNKRDGNHWLNLNAKARHSCLWAIGAVYHNASAPIDVTSIAPYGLSAGGNAVFASSGILPEQVIDPATLRTPPSLPTDYKLEHDPAEFSIQIGDASNNFDGPGSVDKLYNGYFGCSFLFRPKFPQPASFTLYYAHSNVRDDGDYTGGVPPTYSTIYNKQTSYGPIVVRCREYDKSQKLLRIPVKTIEQKYALHANPTAPHDGVADVISRTMTDGTALNWHFFAGSAYQFNGGPPADKHASGMGDEIFTSDSSSQGFKLARNGANVGIDGFDVQGFTIWNAGYNYDTVAGPTPTEIYDTMIYTGSADGMTQLAQVNYHPNGSGRGQATVTFYTG